MCHLATESATSSLIPLTKLLEQPCHFHSPTNLISKAIFSGQISGYSPLSNTSPIQSMHSKIVCFLPGPFLGFQLLRLEGLNYLFSAVNVGIMWVHGYLSPYMCEYLSQLMDFYVG